jgi:hypothetical protein
VWQAASHLLSTLCAENVAAQGGDLPQWPSRRTCRSGSPQAPPAGETKSRLDIKNILQE